MAQIVDLERDPQFQALGVALVSVSTDPPGELKTVATQWKISTPLLSDPDKSVSEAYGVMRWSHMGEPGHTFVLLDRSGKVSWIQDYGAPENGGKMYVPVLDLNEAIAQRVKP